MQVILDLGHVTLSNVSDWSEENAQLSSQPQLLQDIDEDEDDGERECVGRYQQYTNKLLYPPPPIACCYKTPTSAHFYSTQISCFNFADELFQTPPSSPPSEVELEEEENMTDGGVPLSQPVPPHQLHTSLHSLASPHRRLSNDPFERYLLSLSDLQILVGKAEENWKEVTRSGQSLLHLLDRFTLSVRIQRQKKN